MDALIRYHRMQGCNTLWQAGSDHAGIATQMVVERQLAAEGNSRHDLGREKFIEKIWQWKQQSGNTITRQLRRMGSSLDWSRERFTMDEGLSAAVTEVFVSLYEEGLIYRGQRLVNWDPVLHTALSDLEVISEEEQGHLWHMRYPLVGRDQYLIVATTRPETMLGDTAVAVHPEDERYQELIGQEVQLPLTDRTIPIIADEYVDPEFGTGCVKITPAHDFNDYQVGQRHQLPMINIFTIDAKINNQAPTAYQGLDRFDARKQIIADLEAKNLLEKIEDHRLKVPRGDRTHAIIEPLLTDQWFVKAQPLAEPAIEAVKNGDIRFVPENWSKTYFDWLNNIEDWCISRQIWWGHRIPAWYDETGKVYVGRSEQAVREAYQLSASAKLTQDEDVLDTWFSSALWPFSTLGWPDESKALNTFYPTSVLVTGFDIIFFWVARMVMMGLKFTGEVPFKEVYIHGLVRDAEGQKMSKSKGNVLDPIDLIDGISLEELVAKRTSGLMQPQMATKIAQQTKKQFPEGIAAYGTDALRFTFCALASTGRDIRFDLGRTEGYRNFCNKLWNASRFVLMHTENQNLAGDAEPVQLSAADKWIISELQKVEALVIKDIEAYRFDLAAQALYEFTWNQYCDWYLELSKVVLNDPDTTAEARRGTRRTLVRTLEALLRLIHPIMPFITEEIWQKVAPVAGISGETIMLQPYPRPDQSRIDEESSDDIAWMIQFIVGVRNIRGEMNIAPGKLLDVLLAEGNAKDVERVSRLEANLKTVGRLQSIRWLQKNEAKSAAATTLVGQLEVLIPMAGLIDKDAELARLDKELLKLKNELEKAKNKLNNPNYVQKAPPEVVQKERLRLQEAEEAVKKLNLQRHQIAQLS